MMSVEPAPPDVDVDQLDAFHELLPTLARALDVRDIFQQLSTVASRIVPHDEAESRSRHRGRLDVPALCEHAGRRTGGGVPRQGVPDRRRGRSLSCSIRCRGRSVAFDRD